VFIAANLDGLIAREGDGINGLTDSTQSHESGFMQSPHRVRSG
jgi:hypothetical protein